MNALNLAVIFVVLSVALTPLIEGRSVEDEDDMVSVSKVELLPFYLSCSPRLRTLLSCLFMSDILQVAVRCSCVVDPCSLFCIIIIIII